MLILFDKNENQIARLGPSELISAIQEEEINGTTTLKFECSLEAIDKLEGAEYVGHQDLTDPNSIQLYKILVSRPTGNGYAYDCVHTLFDELAGYGYIREVRLESTNALNAINKVLSGSRWQIGTVAGTENRPFYLYDNTRLEGLKKIIETWDIEIEPRFFIVNNRISKRTLNLVKSRGSKTGRRYVYGTNALEVVKETSQAGLYTAVIPRGKGEPTGDGYGRRINIEDVSWARPKNPLDKPKNEEVLEIPGMTEKFGYPDGSPRVKIQVYEDIEDPEVLIQKAYEDLIKNSRPLVQFKAKISESDNLHLGDEVSIIRRDLGIFYKTRVFRCKRNIITGMTDEVEIGDRLELTQADFNKSLRKHINIAKSDLGSSIQAMVEQLQKEISDSMFDDDANWYFLERDNPYGYAPGFYTLNKPIDQNPSRGVFIGGGKMGVSNRVDSNGRLQWTTWATGDGLVADVITSGTLNANLIRAGVLADLLGNFTIDMENGNINIGDKFIYNSKSGELTILGYADDADLQGAKSEFKQTSERILQRVRGAEGGIADLEIEDGRIRQRVGRNETDISSLEIEDGRIRQRVGRNETDISSLEIEDGRIRQRVSRNESDISSLEVKDGQIIASVNKKVDNKDYNASIIVGKINNGYGVSISGDKVNLRGRDIILNGDTRVMGSFKVGDANIGNLRAETITTGTLRVNSSGTHTGTLNNKSATLRNGYYDAKISGSSTGFNANSGKFRFDYGSNSFEVQGRIGANPRGNRLALELNGLVIPGGSFKNTHGSGGCTVRASGPLYLNGSTVYINGTRITPNDSGGWKQ